MMNTIKKMVKSLPGIRGVVQERDELRKLVQKYQQQYALSEQSLQFVPPGHFYSPIPSLDEIKKDEALIWGNPPRNLPGIDMRESDQMILFEEFCQYYRELPFLVKQDQGFAIFL